MKLFLNILTFFLSVGFAMQTVGQTIPISALTETTVSATTLSREQQWRNLKLWVSMTFDKSDVIDMEDSASGTMVIKWAYPVNLKSESVRASAFMTYVVDVKDGKYRIQRLNPHILFEPLFDSNVGAIFENNVGDLNLVKGFANAVFAGSYDWPANENYDLVIDNCREKLASIPQYRNERDRERGKIDSDWSKAERSWQLVRTPLVTLKQLDASMSKSLEYMLNNTDDF